MKKLALYLTLPSILILTSCGGDEPVVTTDPITDTVEQEDLEIDYSDMTLYDLSTHSTMELENLPFKMRLPLVKGSDFASKPVITCNNEISWDIKVGDKFHVVIEPWGTDVKTIEAFKAEVAADGFFTINAIDSDEGLQENESEIVYRRAITSKDGESEGGDPHFYFIKQIDGEYYTVKSHPQGSFTPIRVKDMLRAAKSLE